MPVRHGPASLKELSIRQASHDLEFVCRKLQSKTLKGSSFRNGLDYVKHVLRPYYSLPGTLRSRIIEETSSKLYGDLHDGWALFCGPTQLYLIAILLRPDMKRLRINLCCYYGCTNQRAMLEFLATEGTGLETLELTRFALLRLDWRLLRSSLENMKNLRSLTVRNIANDSILDVIGRSCPNLILLDVAGSREVTDIGIENLMVELKFIDRDSGIEMKKPDELWIDMKNVIFSSNHDHHNQRNNRGNTWSRIKAFLAKFKSKIDEKNKRNDNDNVFIDVEEKRNDICDCLRVINIAKTSVTRAGVFMIMSYATRLESLSEYIHVGRVLESRIHHNRDKCEILSLKEARDCCSTETTLNLLAETCPKLEKLFIRDPRHLPEALRSFVSLTSLTIDDVPMSDQWIKLFYDYLRTNGDKLRELNLRFEQRENARTEIDLCRIFANCPNLVTFENDGNLPVVWNNNDNYPRSMLSLRKVQIGEIVSPAVIVKILELSPVLTSIYVNTCNELDDRHLEILQRKSSLKSNKLEERCFDEKTTNFGDSIVKNLTCFYVNEAKMLSAKCVINIIEYCENLRQIGNIVKWGLSKRDVEDVMNIVAKNYVDLQICPSDWNLSNTWLN